jgi:integrase
MSGPNRPFCAANDICRPIPEKQKWESPEILMRFYNLRHSAATTLLRMGVPANVIQALLGHSKSSITRGVYGHILASMQQEAVEKMSDRFNRRDSPGNRRDNEGEK